MAEMKWTKEQLAAISIRHTDTLVSAAAGSGKTAVLVERVIQMITDPEHPVDVDRLLVVTFTNAAAKQMKQKIGGAIVAGIEKNPRNERLRRQLALLGNAEITTMHSFCMNLMKCHFQKTDLPYDFKLSEPAEAEMLKQDALEEAFGLLYEQQGEKMAALVEWYGERDDKPLMSLILNLYEFLRSIPFYRNWMKNAIQFPEQAISDTLWGGFLMKYAREQLEQTLSLAENAKKQLEQLDEGHGIKPYITTFAEDITLLENLKKKMEWENWDTIGVALKEVSFSDIARMEKGGNKELADRFKKIREKTKAVVGDLQKNVFFQSEEACFRDLKPVEEQITFLAEVIELFEDCYQKKKRQRSLADFSDLEHYCIGILSERTAEGELIPSSVALQLRKQYEEVLIDEYQDTNDVQELIFSLTAGEKKRFMVGDMKQSIYGFRNSKPALFLEKYQQYSKTDGEDTRRLLLSKNFRSNNSILACCNFVFSRLMCKEGGGLDYTEDEALYFGEGYPSENTSAELYVLERKDTEEDETYYQREAEICVRRIRKMVSEGELLYDSKTGEMRPCHYGDFMILLRSLKGRVEYYTDMLNQYDIPYELGKGSSFFESFEVKLAISLLQIIDNPRQDIPLLAVLRSPIFGFDDNFLTELRLLKGEGDYYECLLASKDTCATSFLNTLNRWRTDAENYRVRKLIEQIYEETGLLVYYSQKPDGELRKNRLLLLTKWADSFESTSYRGLFHFITYLQRQMEQTERGVDMADVSTRDNAVSIMSAHKSKGLEANVVFICDCGKRFNFQDINQNRLLADEQLGFGSDCVDTEKHIIFETFVKKAIKQKKKQDIKAEELRLLYVAMTRAKQKLIMIGSENGLESTLNGVRSQIQGTGFEAMIAQNGKSWLEWLLGAFSFHPSAKLLRDCGLPFDSDPGFSFELHWKEEIEEIPEIQKSETEIESEIKDWSALDFTYPYDALCQIPAKLSVSELKRRYDSEVTEEGWMYFPKEIAESPLPMRPAFMREERLTATERGTAYHLAMQYLDLKTLSDKEKITVQLDDFVISGKMTQEDRDEIDVSLLMKFSQTPLYDLICEADRMEREKRFLLPFPAKELFLEAGEEKLLIQGMMDCLVEKEGEFYLMDYKTDSDTDFGRAKKRYGMQLHLYSLAVEQIYGKKPIQSFLYFIKTGEFFTI